MLISSERNFPRGELSSDFFANIYAATLICLENQKSLKHRIDTFHFTRHCGIKSAFEAAVENESSEHAIDFPKETAPRCFAKMLWAGIVVTSH